MTSYENFDGYARLLLDEASERYLEGCIAVSEGLRKPAHPHIVLASPAKREDWLDIEGQTYEAFIQGVAFGAEMQVLLVSLPPSIGRVCQGTPHIIWGLSEGTLPAESEAVLADRSSVTIALDEPIEISVYGDFCYFNS